MKKSYEYYHNGRTPADDGMIAAKREGHKLNDELIPKYAVQPLATQLLIKFAKGEIDMKKLAKEELASRGLDVNGKQVKPKAIKIRWTKGMMLVHTSYANSLEEAEQEILNSKEWNWASAQILFWSNQLGRYITIPK